ncbi:MAG: hypothetical protein ACRDQ5_07530, partial [Sciscionella sp.]
MATSWQEVKAILDNPDVPQDQKHDLLESWANHQDGNRINDEQKNYVKDYAPDTRYDDKEVNNFGYGDSDDDSTDDAYDKAKKSV